jgi:hypothetical protein
LPSDGGRPLETRVGGPNFFGVPDEKGSTVWNRTHAIQRTTHSPGEREREREKERKREREKEREVLLTVKK